MIATITAAIPIVIAFCSALATVLPAPDFGGVASGTPYKVLYATINFVALNLGHAKNKGSGG